MQPPGALASVPDWLRFGAVAAVSSLHGDAPVDFCRRGLRGCHACWQRVARVIVSDERLRWFKKTEVREGELAVEMPPARGAGLIFIAASARLDLARMPRQGRHDGPVCRLEIFEPWYRL
jgi:hypothetical protein